MRGKSKRGKVDTGYTLVFFLVCPSAFSNLVRFHDEATTSDPGSNTGIEYSIVAGAD
jgi:hypothetical protein